MAIIPRATRKIGPVAPAAGPEVNIGALQVDYSGLQRGMESVANAMFAYALKLRDARETSEISTLMTDADKKMIATMADLKVRGPTLTAEERQKVFDEAQNEALAPAANWKGSTDATQALKLHMDSTRERWLLQYTNLDADLTLAQLQRSFEINRRHWLQTGDEVSYRAALDEADQTWLSKEAADEYRKNAPLDFAIEELRQLAELDSEFVIGHAESLQTQAEVTPQQREQLNEVAGMAKGFAAEKIRRQRLLRDQAEANLWADVLEGKEKDVSVIAQAIRTGAVGAEVGKGAILFLQNPDRKTDPEAYDKVRAEIDQYHLGNRSLTAVHTVLGDQMAGLSDTDAKGLHEMMYDAKFKRYAYLRSQSRNFMRQVIFEQQGRPSLEGLFFDNVPQNRVIAAQLADMALDIRLKRWSEDKPLSDQEFTAMAIDIAQNIKNRLGENGEGLPGLIKEYGENIRPAVEPETHQSVSVNLTTGEKFINGKPTGEVGIEGLEDLWVWQGLGEKLDEEDKRAIVKARNDGIPIKRIRELIAAWLEENRSE